MSTTKNTSKKVFKKSKKKTKNLENILLYKIGLEGTARYTGILLAPEKGFFTLFFAYVRPFVVFSSNL